MTSTGRVRPAIGGRGPYHPHTARRRRAGRRLRVSDATAMSVGGMIGGGIFSVLGVTVELAGHLAFACFLVGGGVALTTARSYAGLSRGVGHSAGPYGSLLDAGHPEIAALTSWLLVLGYVVCLAVYAFTFGHYIAHLFHGGEGIARLLSAAILTAFWLVNVRGVGASALTEDTVVGAKLVALVVIAGVGLAHWSNSRLTPVADHGSLGVFVGAASIFVAYEGFELLSYDYDDMEQPERTMPRSLYLSVAIVIAVYVLVTLGSQMVVPDSVLIGQLEVAFATVGQRALGSAGRWLATGAAALATSSAINATLFSAARLTRDLSAARQLPAVFGRSHRSTGTPSTAMWAMAAGGAALAMLPGILELLAFGSATFLAVFAIVNQLHGRSRRGWERWVAYGGAAACWAAIVVLVVQLARHDRAGLALVVGCLAAVCVLRVLFVRTHPTAASRRPRQDSNLWPTA